MTLQNQLDELGTEGTLRALVHVLNKLESILGMAALPSTGELRVAVGNAAGSTSNIGTVSTITTLSTVTTVSTVAALTQLSNFRNELQVMAESNMHYLQNRRGIVIS